MFYSGDLQSGIKAAIQHSKLVACFVGDDGQESMTWENDFLVDGEIAPLFAEKTILLRLGAGSEEAGFLAAIYPLPKTPTLVIMQSGQLKEYLNAGVSKQDFIQRVKIILCDSNDPSPSGGPLAPESALEAGERAPVEAPQSRAVQEVLEERRSRLETAKKQQDAYEKAERAANAQAKKEALEAAASSESDPKKAADMKYALLQKKRQQDARAERERILKRVEDDKAERRAKEVLRKEQARVAAGSSIHAEASTAQSSSIRGPTGNKATECAIQVRLFDGTTIRSRFPSHNTLSKDIREWVDSQGADSGMPYNFKQILTPLPNRTIEMSEEEQTLRNLGLTPSATLVLTPISDYSSAYQGGATGLLSRGLSAGFGLVSSGLGLVSGTLTSVLGSGAPTAVTLDQDSPRRSSRAPPDDHQLYNGNALNFEPRRDDIDKED